MAGFTMLMAQTTFTAWDGCCATFAMVERGNNNILLLK
jgi:hypothetical protein